jgi:hypothetical protein
MLFKVTITFLHLFFFITTLIKLSFLTLNATPQLLTTAQAPTHLSSPLILLITHS